MLLLMAYKRTMRKRWRWLSGSGSSMNLPREWKFQERWQRCDNTESHDLGDYEYRAMSIDIGYKLWCGPLIRSFADDVASDLHADESVHQELHSYPFYGNFLLHCSASTSSLASLLWSPSICVWPWVSMQQHLTSAQHPAHPSTVVPWPGVLPSLPVLASGKPWDISPNIGSVPRHYSHCTCLQNI